MASISDRFRPVQINFNKFDLLNKAELLFLSFLEMVILSIALQKNWIFKMINSSPTSFNFIGEVIILYQVEFIKGHAHIFGNFTGKITGDKESILTIEYTGKVHGSIKGLMFMFMDKYLVI